MFINCSLSFWLVSFTTVLDLAGHAALIVLYSQLQNKYETVDIPMYEYLRDNQCTDGALARGIEQDHQIIKEASSFKIQRDAILIPYNIFRQIDLTIGYHSYL